MLSFKMIELRLRELRDLYATLPGYADAASALDSMLSELTDESHAINIDDAQLLPTHTILANLTDCYIKSYPDVTHPWRSSNGRVISDMAMNSLIQARSVALFRYGTGLDHNGDPT